MTEEQYDNFCDSYSIPKEESIKHRKVIKKTLSYQIWELSNSITELKQAFIDSFPKWLKRLLSIKEQ